MNQQQSDAESNWATVTKWWNRATIVMICSFVMERILAGDWDTVRMLGLGMVLPSIWKEAQL